MEANKILQSDVLDILFEDRNKAYGAYDLRKTYHKRLRIALLVTLALFIVAFGASFLSKSMATDSEELKINDVVLEDIKQEEPKPEPPPPPPPPKQEPPKVEMTKFTPPVIVKDEEVKKEDIPPEVEKLEDTKIALETQEGIKDEGIAVPVVDEGKAVVEAPKDETNYDQTFTKVEVDAQFPGGLAGWTKYVQRNVNGQVASDNGAPAGTYQVVVQFIVDKEGNISDVKALTSHGYGMEEEAIRAIKRGPKWTPAIQNGRNVKAYRRQPIAFVVSEE